MKHWFSDVPAFQRDPLAFLVERGSSATRALEPMALGPKPVLLLTDPELIKPLLKADEADADKRRLIHKLRPIVGMSSLVISGEDHRRRRQALHGHLARSGAEKLVPQMAAEIRRLAAQLAEAGRFDPHRVTAPLALRMICIAVFGRQVLSEADEAALVGAVNTVEDELAEDMFRMIPLMPWAWWARQRRRAQGRTTMSVVVQRLRQAAGGASAIKALEDLGLTDDQVRDEILTLLLAGDHTTGSSAAWLLYHLASEPGLMDAIADEASAISDRNGEITAAGLKQAPLSLALTREVLRLYPSAWWFSREVKRPMHFGGMDLKPGTSIIISPWQLHRDPKHWAEPDTFRLDRTYTSKAYVPFGAGPRACIGLGVAMLELQLLALELAAAYRFAGVTPYPARLPKPSVTLIPPEMSIDIGLREKRRVRVASAA
jgi:cytochrome P450